MSGQDDAIGVRQIAALPMYDFADLRAAHDTLWKAIAEHLAAHGNRCAATTDRLPAHGGALKHVGFSRLLSRELKWAPDRSIAERRAT